MCRSLTRIEERPITRGCDCGDTSVVSRVMVGWDGVGCGWVGVGCHFMLPDNIVSVRLGIYCAT